MLIKKGLNGQLLECEKKKMIEFKKVQKGK
jgi:hypothetical protein